MKRTFSFLLVLLAAGCASSPGPDQGDGDRTVITREQISETGLDSLIQVIRRLRPWWLRNTATRAGSEDILVYENLNPKGGLNMLATINPQAVDSLVWMNRGTAAERMPAIGVMGREPVAVIIAWTRVGGTSGWLGRGGSMSPHS